MKNRVIITADDYGMGVEANKGILYCADKEIINSVSVCVNYEKVVKSNFDPLLKRDITTGLHLNFSDGISLSNLDELKFRKRLKSPIQLLSEEIGEEVFLEEILYQVDRFGDIFGRPPEYLDGHQYLSYLIPGAFSSMCKVANRYGVPIRNPQAFTNESNLEEFKSRIFSRQGVNLPFESKKRSQKLGGIFKRSKVLCRTEVLWLDVPSYLPLSPDSIEIVSHPYIKKGYSDDIAKLEKLNFIINDYS